jgi:hypothetical protein
MAASRRSNIVSLTLIGAVGLFVFRDELFPGSTGPETRRNYYADRAACERDYSAGQCEVGGNTTSHGYAHGWYGPSYLSNRSLAGSRDPGPGRVGGLASAVHTSTSTSSRGGFGGTAHAWSGGG